ncbi:MAG: hypothetical protein J4G11_13000, partial [Acidimicrobiia bacterium]|nr:hypothetical protein [Acidimicrobiia bacterium]
MGCRPGVISRRCALYSRRPGSSSPERWTFAAGTLVTFAYLFRMIAMPMRIFAWLLGMLPAAV